MAATVPPEVRTIVQKIAESYAPERIILFGSWAEGRAREDSDVDLLVVKATDERPLDRVRSVRRSFRGTARTLGIDIVVLTPEELEGAIRRRHSLVTRALRQGVVLYAA